MRIHDGAYGTLLGDQTRGDETVDDLCLRAPARVVDAHRAYIEAGAQAIQTNAFLAHLRTSDRRRRELQLAALGCAREAVGDRDVLVVATVGPAGDEPSGYWRDLELLLEHEVRAVLCETITTRATADAFLAAWADVARGVDDVELLVGCSIAPSRGAGAAAWVVELASDAPDQVELGLNCCEGVSGMRPVLEQILERRGRAWAMPSAGLPVEDGAGQSVWPLQEPGRWADAVASELGELGLSAIGGCCGTSPGSIAALCRILHESS